MSGTSLVILAMYATVNVARSSNGRLDPGALPYVVALLFTAALLTMLAIWLERSGVRRKFVGRSSLPALKRRHGYPGPRRH